MKSEQPLKILYLAAEVVPFAKTGGLADVAGSLPKAVHALGHDIRVAMPRYGPIDKEKFKLKEILPPFPVPLDDGTEPASILEASLGEVPVYFVENEKYYDREGIYMYPDDAERFIFLCRAALEMLKKMGWQPDIIHSNDWHTAIIPNWLKTIYGLDLFFERTATVYTIHNLAYKGIFGHRVLEIAGIDEYAFPYHPEMVDMNQVMDFMARGIFYADVINTVSESYSREILTPELGEGLDPILRDRRDRLFGILNGIDYEVYNPATDRYIASNFDIHRLERRLENKLALQQEARLSSDPARPLVGIISRLTDQKGFDILSQVIDPLIDNLGLHFVLLGTGEERYHEMFRALEEKRPQETEIFLTFNAPLARRIYAGSDIFLMPSRFEPCGLGQMIAMRYGGVPVVRNTGGLADTVQDFDPGTGQGNGFSFQPYNPMALYTTLTRAVENYKHQATWRTLMLRGMTADFSWQASAGKYVDLYYRALAIKAGEHKPEEYEALSRDSGEEG